MKFNENSPRYRAGHAELEGGTGGITRMCSAGDFLEVYKIDKTFRIYTPESLDPNETDPNMQSMSKPVADVGSSNRIVARVFIQASEAIKSTPVAININKDEVLRCMHRCKEQLLICENKQLFICKEVERINQIFLTEQLKKEGNHLMNFPQVDNLNEYCGVFLNNAKLTIQTLAELINIFYKTTFDGPRFDKVVEWSRTALKHNADFIQLLQYIQPFMKHIVDIRNAQEHPKECRKLVIENFILKPHNVISVPVWHITNEGPVAIHNEMTGIIDFLINVVEVTFLYCLMDNIKSSFPFIVRSIDDSELNPICPTKYRVEPYIEMPHNKSHK